MTTAEVQLSADDIRYRHFHYDDQCFCRWHMSIEYVREPEIRTWIEWPSGHVTGAGWKVRNADYCSRPCHKCVEFANVSVEIARMAKSA